MANNSTSSTVSELQNFLKERGVIVANFRKAELQDLCTAAIELGIELDPDGVLEDRGCVLDEKLHVKDIGFITNPSMIDGDNDLSVLPPLTIVDIYSYLIHFSQFTHAELRDYHKMEGFSMFQDGYVVDIKTVKCEVNGEKLKNFCAIRSNVKPRTNEKDPVSKKPYYSLWIILSKEATQGSIISAYCTCKGGMDGCCRHVIATLFEVSDYLEDRLKKSVTSGPCQWLRRIVDNNQPLLATDLDTSLQSKYERVDIDRPVEETYNPVPEEVPLPPVAEYFNSVKRLVPNACALDAVEVRPKKKRSPPNLNIKTPKDKACDFLKGHAHDCIDTCKDDFKIWMKYSEEELKEIEKGTRGQSENELWFKMRKGLLTSSKFKDIVHSTNRERTAEVLLQDNTFREDKLPLPIQYGRKNENKARNIYLKSHRYRHRACSIEVPGLIISRDKQHLAASPDGVVSCKYCGKYLVEVKCMWSFRNFHPKTAITLSKLAHNDLNGNLVIDKKHKYYYQIQGQMAVSGILKCVLVVFTNKGIETLDIDFDQEFWNNIELILQDFYFNSFYPAMKCKPVLT